MYNIRIIYHAQAHWTTNFAIWLRVSVNFQCTSLWLQWKWIENFVPLKWPTPINLFNFPDGKSIYLLLRMWIAYQFTNSFEIHVNKCFCCCFCCCYRHRFCGGNQCNTINWTVVKCEIILLYHIHIDSIRIIELIHQKWCIFSTMVTSFEYLVHYLWFFFSLKNMNKKWIRRIHHWFNHNIKCTLIDFYSRLTTIIRINFDIRHNGHHCKWWIVFQCDGVRCAFLSIISPNSDNSGDLHTHTNNVYTIYI